MIIPSMPPGPPAPAGSGGRSGRRCRSGGRRPCRRPRTFGLGDQVDHVEAEALDALALPEAEDRGQLGPDLGVLPVQVGLADVEQVQVHLPRLGTYAQAGPPNLDTQLVGSLSGLPSGSPKQVGGGVVEHHVQHQADAALCRSGIVPKRGSMAQ